MKQITDGTSKYVANSAYAGPDPSIYNKIIRKKGLFQYGYNFFALGLVYGILHNKKSTERRRHDIIRLEQISDEAIRDVIDICYMILNDGREEKEIINELLSFADGGIKELYKIYDDNGSFQLPMLIEDSKEIWRARIMDLHNINLEDYHA